MDAVAGDLVALGVLSEPQRARIYAHIAGTKEPCSRQEVSETLGIGRTLVAFHLDKLQRAGLVRTVAGRAASGGRGRPPQRFAVTRRDLSASVPPRRYELLAELLVQAVAEHTADEPLRKAALRVARRRGSELAHDAAAGKHPSTARDLLADLLERLGYQPRHNGNQVVLTNCPFERLRIHDSELVCSINLALATGYLEGLGLADDFAARLAPCPVNCCVVLEPAA
ncbi:helix-turn-helix transcriptional regulator [Pseudonocardia nigra]|uniref:helix-turn-helix transcriptional regulator n=1 Tax=Pseudonocardia nigra TaxID=1921578 RepID=UPI001C5E9364|nr:helix-turn-helix domain-containing protein [Pseudonocardia nigra]